MSNNASISSGYPQPRGHVYTGCTGQGSSWNHFGDVINQYTERPETPPEPFNSVPFPRDPEFVDCGELEQVKQRLLCGSKIAALVGLGGVGKSQIAIECTYRLRERSPETWVLWIHASNAARFEASVRDVAEKLKLRGRKDPTENVFRLLHNWLFDKENGIWVVVLDNVDDLNLLPEYQNAGAGSQGSEAMAASPMLSRLFPVCDHGSVLITSRSKAITRKLVEDRDIVVVQPMLPKFAEILLLLKLRTKVPLESRDSECPPKLVEAVGCMPLAITQAAAYIKRREPRCTLQQYLTKLRQSKSNPLKRDDENLRRDSKATNSIFLTWQISFGHIEETRPSAAHLLSVLSFFDRQAIPSRLCQRKRKDEDLKQLLGLPVIFIITGSDTENGSVSSESDDGLEDDITLLRDYYFISMAADGSAFEMHRLVQRALQEYLRELGQLEQGREAFVELLALSYPRPLMKIGLNAECFSPTLLPP